MDRSQIIKHPNGGCSLMKKLLTLILGVALLFTLCFSAFAEDAAKEESAEDAPISSEKSYAEEINPHGYKLIHITDVFTPDPELDENDEPIDTEEGPVIQCSFGDIDLTDESDPQFIGFEKEGQDDENDEENEDSFDGETFTLGLSPECELLLPTDFENPTENHKVAIEDFEDWTAKLSEVKGGIDFYATFEMDDDGTIKKLEYFWTPFD